MPWTRNKTHNRNAWMWLAIAAVAFTSVAHAETGRQSPKGYAHPVFEFLVRSQTQNSGALSGAFANPGSRTQANSYFRSSGSGPLIAMLPVLFIGLVSPLGLQTVAANRSFGRAPAAPLLPVLFQRPPPAFA
jgi:hypothetical protein